MEVESWMRVEMNDDPLHLGRELSIVVANLVMCKLMHHGSDDANRGTKRVSVLGVGWIDKEPCKRNPDRNSSVLDVEANSHRLFCHILIRTKCGYVHNFGDHIAKMYERRPDVMHEAVEPTSKAFSSKLNHRTNFVATIRSHHRLRLKRLLVERIRIQRYRDVDGPRKSHVHIIVKHHSIWIDLTLTDTNLVQVDLRSLKIIDRQFGYFPPRHNQLTILDRNWIIEVQRCQRRDRGRYLRLDLDLVRGTNIPFRINRKILSIAPVLDGVGKLLFRIQKIHIPKDLIEVLLNRR